MITCLFHINKYRLNLGVVSLGLRANIGRFESINYNERICPICNSDIETEMHFLLVFPYYDHLRQEFIPSYFYIYPSEIKFKSQN